jgi:hypothetical protein
MAYTNAQTFFQKLGFTLISDEAVFRGEKKVTFKCPLLHESILTVNSFNNKRVAYNKGNVKNFCATCLDIENEEESKRDFTKRIEQRGHKVISINLKERKAEYECGNCESIQYACIQNLLISKGYCRVCENWHHKLPYPVLKAKVEEMDVILLTTEEEYINNKMMLRILCSCGREDQKALSDIRKGKKCNEFCRLQKCRDTCLERYGVDNVSKDPAIFEKIMRSVYRRKEYTLPNGRVIALQGYEPQAIDYLLDQIEDKFLQRKIEADEFRFGKDVPSFDYTDEEGVERVYHPDFAIGDMIIEVKGDWTLHSQKEKNIRKFQAVNERGYRLRLLLLYENGEVQEDLLVQGDELREMEFRDKGRRY